MRARSPRTASPASASVLVVLGRRRPASISVATDGTVFVCIEGSGETRIGDQVLTWRPRDVVVVPAWARHSHHASEDAVLFSFSDRVVQEKLGLWREERGSH